MCPYCDSLTILVADADSDVVPGDDIQSTRQELLFGAALEERSDSLTFDTYLSVS